MNTKSRDDHTRDEWRALLAADVAAIAAITVEVVRAADRETNTTPLARIAKHYGKPVAQLTPAERAEGMKVVDINTVNTVAAWKLQVTFRGEHVVTDKEATDIGWLLWEHGADQTFPTRKAAQAAADTFVARAAAEAADWKAYDFEELPLTFTTA